MPLRPIAPSEPSHVLNSGQGPESRAHLTGHAVDPAVTVTAGAQSP